MKLELGKTSVGKTLNIEETLKQLELYRANPDFAANHSDQELVNFFMGVLQQFNDEAITKELIVSIHAHYGERLVNHIRFMYDLTNRTAEQSKKIFEDKYKK